MNQLLLIETEIGVHEKDRLPEDNDRDGDGDDRDRELCDHDRLPRGNAFEPSDRSEALQRPRW